MIKELRYIIAARRRNFLTIWAFRTGLCILLLTQRRLRSSCLENHPPDLYSRLIKLLNSWDKGNIFVRFLKTLSFRLSYIIYSMARQRKEDKQHVDKKESSRGHSKATKASQKGSKQKTSRQHLLYSITESKVVVVLIAIIICYAHGYHISTLFENDRFFSHLSNLERQMSFRTEMGLYYSYYKTIIDAPSMSDGLLAIIEDNVTEYPSTINVLKRFNLYPEVILGVGFRWYQSYLAARGISGKDCFTIHRGYGQPPVESCEGMGDEAYFYVNPIFFLNGLFMGTIFLLCVYLGGGIAGGVVAVSAFFFNHGEATRVQWTPPLRESFGVPFFFMQLLAVSFVIRSKRQSIGQLVAVVITTVCFMLPWQFAQFALLTQTLSLFGCFVLHFLPLSKLKFLVVAQSVALVINFVFQFGNAMLLTSFFASCLVSVLLLIALNNLFNNLRIWPLSAALQVIALLTLTVLSKNAIAYLLNVADDAHIGDILRSKFTDYKDFHTQLYTCAREFDFLGWEMPLNLLSSLLLPAGGLALLLIGVQSSIFVWRQLFPSHSSNGKGKSDNNETATTEDECDGTKAGAELFYHLLQNFAFLAMAVLIMRLKLFFTPHLCVMAGLLGSRTLVPISPKYRLILLAVLLGGMAVAGTENLKVQYRTSGEFNDAPQEELYNWIQRNTPKDAVFAGSMPSMAGVKLNAHRPIVNHPHYEDAGLRKRTEKVYQIYSRKPVKVVAASLRGLGVQYVLLEPRLCDRETGTGCGQREIWDSVDVKNRGKPVFCDLTMGQHAAPAPFVKVFKNENYHILKLN